MRNGKSYEIALSGISSALALIFLIMSIFIEYLTLSLLVISAVFTLLPLTKNYWKGAILSYIVVSIIGFFVGAVNALPYIVFFGAYAIIQWLTDIVLIKKLKFSKAVSLIIVWLIKLAYFQFVIFLSWTFMKVLIADINFFGLEITYWLITVIGNILFIFYDFCMLRIYYFLQKFVANKIK